MKFTVRPDGVEQYTEEFFNGYGVSVIRGEYTYGGKEGLYELAVLKGGSLCYDTCITDDVIGYLSMEQVKDIIQMVQQLPHVLI